MVLGAVLGKWFLGPLLGKCSGGSFVRLVLFFLFFSKFLKKAKNIDGEKSRAWGEHPDGIVVRHSAIEASRPSRQF